MGSALLGPPPQAAMPKANNAKAPTCPTVDVQAAQNPLGRNIGTPWLLVTQGINGFEATGSQGWIKTKQQAHYSAETYSQDHCVEPHLH